MLCLATCIYRGCKKINKFALVTGGDRELLSKAERQTIVLAFLVSGSGASPLFTVFSCVSSATLTLKYQKKFWALHEKEVWFWS